MIYPGPVILSGKFKPSSRAEGGARSRGTPTISFTQMSLNAFSQQIPSKEHP